MGTVVKAMEITCTEAESARVVVSYTRTAVTGVPAPAPDVGGTDQLNTVASTVVTQVSVKPRNLAIVMKEEVGDTVMCYGTSGTPLGESAAARESRAQNTTESRRHLTDMFTVDVEDPAEQPQAVPGEMHTQREAKPVEAPAEDRAGGDQPAHLAKKDATPAAEAHESAHTVTTPAGQEGQQVASMLQEAGLAEVLVVDDVLRALEHDPSKVTYVVRALAWNKLSEEEQSKALNEAREHRGALELPYRPSFSSMQGNSLCEHCDGMMYQPALNADSEDKLRYHMQRDEDGQIVHLRGSDMQAGSTWTECGSYAACGQCVAAQAILKGQLHAHASAACILGDGLLVAALQHHVRGHIRKSETEATAGGEPHRSTTRNEEAAHTTRHDSRSPSRVQRKRRASRSPDRRPPRSQDSRPRNRGSRSRSPRARARARSRTPRRRSYSPWNRSPSPRRGHRASSPRRAKSDTYQDGKR